MSQQQLRELDILQLFNSDRRAHVAPYSIQNVAEIGLKDYGVYPGDWYGINTASLIFENLDCKFNPLQNFKICTFQDGNICLPKIQELGCQRTLTASQEEMQEGYEVIQDEIDMLAGSNVTGSMSFDFESSRMSKLKSEASQMAGNAHSELPKP